MERIYQVQVGKDGMLTLPKAIQDNHRIETGDILTITDVGNGVFVIHPRQSIVDEIAEKIAKEWQGTGVTLDSMLDTLRDVRADHDAEEH